MNKIIKMKLIKMIQNKQEKEHLELYINIIMKKINNIMF